MNGDENAVNERLGERRTLSVKTTAVLKNHLFGMMKRVGFSDDFEKLILNEIGERIPMFSGHVSTLTLTDDTLGREIRGGSGGRRLTFSVNEFTAILYFLAQKSQKEEDEASLAKDYRFNVFRVKVEREEKKIIVPVIVRWNRRAPYRGWLVSCHNGDFDDSLWRAGSKIFFPE